MPQFSAKDQLHFFVIVINTHPSSIFPFDKSLTWSLVTLIGSALSQAAQGQVLLLLM